MPKAYDLVLYGATGVTGREMCKHLLAHAPRSLRWAIAGRNKAKLETLLEELAPRDSSADAASRHCHSAVRFVDSDVVEALLPRRHAGFTGDDQAPACIRDSVTAPA